MGKLSEKLGKPCEKYFSYYQKAADMNPSAVDTLYRLHASRLKLLCSRRMDDKDIIKVMNVVFCMISEKVVSFRGNYIYGQVISGCIQVLLWCWHQGAGRLSASD
jgi:hypothetical protein